MIPLQPTNFIIFGLEIELLTFVWLTPLVVNFSAIFFEHLIKPYYGRRWTPKKVISENCKHCEKMDFTWVKIA